MTVTPTKVSEKIPADQAYPSDLLMIVFVDSNTGITTTKSINITNFFANVSSNVTINAVTSVANLIIKDNHTPLTSSETRLAGSIYFDSDYLYITTQNNVTKRIPLQSF